MFDHKISYLVKIGQFWNFSFFMIFLNIFPTYGQFLLKIEKNDKFRNPEKSDGLADPNKVSQNTFKNTPEDGLNTFFNITSHMTSKYRLNF
jgi:hypothetical protein